MNEAAEQARAQAILKASRVKQILESDEVKDAFQRLRANYVLEWKNAQDVAGRETAWAKQRALEDIESELLAVQSAGERARLEQERADRMKAAQPRPLRR